MYNPITLAELKETYSWFDWSTYFNTVFLDTEVEIGEDERFIMVQPSYFAAAEQIEVTYEVVGEIIICFSFKISAAQIFSCYLN